MRRVSMVVLGATFFVFFPACGADPTKPVTEKPEQEKAGRDARAQVTPAPVKSPPGNPPVKEKKPGKQPPVVLPPVQREDIPGKEPITQKELKKEIIVTDKQVPEEPGKGVPEGEKKQGKPIGEKPALEPGKAKPPEWPTEISGKSLDQWLVEVASKDRSKSERAIQTLVHFGPPAAKKAVHTLVIELHKHKPNFGQILDMSVRSKSVVALGVLIPFIEDSATPDVQDAIGLMVAMLDDDQIALRFRAIQALSNLGPAAQKAIPKLILRTEQVSSWETRQVACAALGMIVPVDKKTGPLEPKAVAALYKALRDNASQVRLAAIQSLLRLGAGHFDKTKADFVKTLEAIAKVEAALREKDQDPFLIISVHMALMGQDKTKDEVRRSVIAGFLNHGDTLVRVEAATAFSNMGPDARDQKSKLIAGLRDRDPNVALLCVMALGNMERAAADAFPMLERLAKDEALPEPLREASRVAMDFVSGKRTLQKPPPPKGTNK